MSSEMDERESYGFVPEHLRHHFCVDAFIGGDALERDAIRCARRMRSAHLVSSALADALAAVETADTAPGASTSTHRAAAKAKGRANAATKTPIAPVPVSDMRLYSHAVERAITSRMTFDRTLARLEAYFQQHANTLKRLETTHAAVVPVWLYDGSAKLPTLLQVQRHVVQAIESCVNDSDIYLAMFEALPSPPMPSPTPLLRFAVCSSKSSMQHRVLVSTVDGPDPTHSSEPQSNQDVDSAHARLPSQAQRARNTVSFEAMAIRRELVIEDIEAYSHEQIRRFTPDTVTGPFACFPLLGTGDGDDNSATAVPIGVLALDSCRKALRLRPESMTAADLSDFLTRKHLRDAAVELRRHKVAGAQFLAITERDLNHKPMFSSLKIATRKRLLELVHLLRRGAMVHLARPAQYFLDDPDAMRFLRDVAQSTGVFLDGYRSVHWHQVMANATRDAACTVYDVFDVLVRALARTLGRAERVVVWKVAPEPRVEIAVMASTHVPDDRLMPFLQWTERLIKRVVLYKEASPEEDACRLVQGTITRIIASNQSTRTNGTTAPQSPSPSRQDATALCETAQYIVSWSNRTLERLSWTQLRQLLPIRAMNTKHFQLTHLLERLAHRHHHCSVDASRTASKTSNSASASKDADVIRLATPHGVALVIQDVSCAAHTQYVLQVDFADSSDHRYDNSNNSNQDSATNHSDGGIRSSAIALLQRAVGITEKSLACVRGREARRLNRQLSSVRVSQAFHSIGLTPSPDALRALSEVVARVFAEITASLPGVEVQLAELQSDGAQLRYTFAANGSTLLGKVLNRGQGVSFRCVDTKAPLVVQSGSEDASRLRRLGRHPEVGSSAEAEFPFVFLPLVHDDCIVGVVSVNRFVDVPKGRQDEPQPEAGVLAYLESVVKPLGAAVYFKRRSHALYELQMLAREPLRSPHQLFYHACCAVKDTVVGAWKVRVVEVDCTRGKTSAVYELSEAERALAASQDFTLTAPLRLRSPELMDDTVAQHFGLEAAALVAIHTRVDELVHADAADAQALVQLESDVDRRTGGGPSVAVAESEKRRLESKRVASKYFALLLTDAQEREDTTQASDRTVSSEKYVNNALSVFLGSKTNHTSAVASLALRTTRVFLAVSSLPQFHAVCEHNYVARVSETLSKLMDQLHARVERSRRRVRALEVFRATCAREVAALQRRLAVAPADAASSTLKSASTSTSSRTSASVRLTPDEELAIESVDTLQEQAISLIENTLASPNVYIGLLEPSLGRIRYTSASKRSVMRGKHLKRGHGVGFDVLATQAPVVVTQHDWRQGADGDSTATTASQYARQLRRFTPESTEQTWPFIVVPIGALGTLSLDNLERYERLASEPQPELGVVDFLRLVGNEMRIALDTVRAASLAARQALRAQALTRILAACDDVRPHAPLYIQTVVVQEIEASLTGVDVYIGIVQPLCESICFTSASSRSGMANACADTDWSASFRVYTTQRQLVVSDVRAYLQRQDNAAIAANGKLRVLRPASVSLTASYVPAGPFVCVPIPFVGVLSVDTFPGAARGTYSSRVPERGVVEFLSRVANHLGEHMRTRSALAAAQRIPTLFQGNKSTLAVVFHDLLELLSANIVAADALFVLRFTRDAGRRELPLLAHLERATKSPHRIEIDTLKTRVLEQIEFFETRADDSASARCVVLPGTPEVVLAVLDPTRDVDDENGALASTVLVLRRVRGATWMYDLELLQSLAPLVNTVISQVNVRIEAIVARRHALNAIDALSRRLEALPSHEAVAALQDATREAIEHIAAGLSCTATCDVYMGERTVGGDALVFSYATRESGMESASLSLLDDANQSLVTVQCLATKHPSIVHLMDTPAKNERLLRPLSDKKCVRVHVVVPMGDDRILCTDSLGLDAFHPATRRLEPDVLAFFTASAAKLHDVILTTHYRRSYDDLVCLKAPEVRHPNFRRFFATLLEIVRRDLVVFHSQQVLTLASDFTGRYFTEAWHAAPTRRPLARGSAPTHMCYLNQCDARLIALGVHYESRVELPMTNLPRTLDTSRSSLEPAEGREKRGAFACACLATMLDAHFAVPRVALCVYSHDATSRARAPTVFTPTQRQFFFALAAVAADVFTHVYRSCALYSIADEFFVSLRELLSAKDGLAVRVHSSKDDSSVRHCVVLCSSQETKFPRNSVLPDALATKVQQFAQSATDFAVFVRKKPDAALLGGVPAQAAGSAVPTSPASVGSTGAPDSRTTQAKAPSRSFFKRPAQLFGVRKANAAAPPQAQAVVAPTAAPAATLPNASEAPLDQQPRYKFHVLVRGVPVFGRPDIFSFDIERRSMDSVKALEQITKRWRASAQSIVDTFVKTPLRGDEAMLRPVLGPDARSDAYHVSTGSGYYLLAQLTQARERFQHQALGLQADIRAYLTGVQATARDIMLSGRPADALEHASVSASTPSHTAEPSVFADDGASFGTQRSRAAMALVEASMLLIGAKKDALAKLDKHAVLKEFLRSNAAKKAAAVSPRDRKQWGSILRARAHLAQAQDDLSVVLSQSSLLLPSSPPQRSAPPLGTHHSLAHSKHLQPSGASPPSAMTALCALYSLHMALAAIVRYEKQLDADAARERLRVDRNATVLQCAVRMLQAKARLTHLRKLFVAARQIQCAFRQHLARRHLLFLKWTRAATKIQRAYRLKLLRRRGSRPKRLSDELLAISKQFGGLAPSSATLSRDTGAVGDDHDGAWRTEMDAFKTFASYIASRAGKEQLKREETVMFKRMHELTKAREKLPADERMREDVHDLFELLDTDGRGELSRDAMRLMMARLRIPLGADETDDVIEMMDSDGSGAISLSEFMSWFSHEYAVLKKRSRDCGVVSRKDWQWVIEHSAREALRKRYRALRLGRHAIPRSEHAEPGAGADGEPGQHEAQGEELVVDEQQEGARKSQSSG